MVPFAIGGPGGVAVDAAGNLWVGETGLEQLDSFDSSCGFIGPEPVQLKGGTGSPPLGPTAPASLSIDYSTGQFDVIGTASKGGYSPHVEVFDGTGTLVKQWEIFGQPAHVAVDNSCSLHKPVLTELTLLTCKEFDASNGSVYVSHGTESRGGDGLPKGIEKFSIDAAGEPQAVPFTVSESYIEGNQIVGTPEGTFEHAGEAAPVNVTIDSQGDIYAIGSIENKKGTIEPGEVYEYRPDGEFVQAFAGAGTAGLAGSVEAGGWGGDLNGVTVDSSSDHLLVSVSKGVVEGATIKGEGAVDEFDIVTGKFLGQIMETSTGEHLHHPEEMTVDPSGDLYVVDHTIPGESEPVHVVDEYGPAGAERPSVKVGEASERTSSSAVVSGSVDPEDLALSACGFQYVTEETFSREGFSAPNIGEVECEPAASNVPVDDVFHAVHAKLTGLISGTAYRYRLVATTLGGGEAESGSFEFTTPGAPRIVSASASNISSAFAELRAVIDPVGSSTSYRFEYDTSPYTNGEPHGVSVPIPDEGVGSGGSTGGVEASVVQQVGGLVPGTTYYYRVVASNAEGVAQGAGLGNGVERREATFTTLSYAVPGLLPDNRAYELVTPPNKGGAEDMFASISDGELGDFVNDSRGYPAESGNGFLLETLSAFESFPVRGISPASGNNVYVFKRGEVEPGETGWQTVPLASRSLGVQGIFASVFEPFEMSRVGFEDRVGSAGSEDGLRPESIVGSPRGSYTTLSVGLPESSLEGSSGAETEIVGASHDLGHVVLESANHTLAPGTEEEGLDEGSEALYEWDGGGECTPETSNCTLIDVNSEGSLLSKCGAVLGEGNFQGGSHEAVSADGSKIFLTAPDPANGVEENGVGVSGLHARPIVHSEGCWNPDTNENTPQLYMRSEGETVEVSAPEASVVEGGGSPVRYPAIYVGAAEDGSEVFFISEGWLTEDHPAGHDRELYEYNTETKRLTLVSAGEPGSPSAAGAGAAVYTVPAVSASGSVVYFTALGQLTSNAPEPGSSGVNLYHYETATHTTTYVATVNRVDYPSTDLTSYYGGKNPFETGDNPGEIALDPEANWYTTPDGDYLLFGSVASLTGYDNAVGGSGHCPLLKIAGGSTAATGVCSEVYRYRYESGGSSGGSIVCVSCDRSGERPVSNAFFGDTTGGERPADGPVSAISDGGEYVFFDSADPLVPAADNGTLDVYEWEAQGRGGCELVQGCVHLISSGEDPAPSFFLGESPYFTSSGEKIEAGNVFFGTHAKLVPQDTDTAGDLYDARVCEPEKGDPCIQAPSGRTGQCEGAACQNQPSAPVDTTPVSLTFSGPGDVTSEVKPSTVVKPKAKTTAQKLASALKACRKDKSKKKRASCEKRARKKYRVSKKAGKTSRGVK